MVVFQYIIFSLMVAILPITWIYSLIKWILGGCRIPLCKFQDVAICERDDDNMDAEDLAILRQMLDDYIAKIEKD